MNEMLPLPVRAPKLTPARRLCVYGAGLGLWGTGALWLVAHYFWMRDSPFGPTPHPLEFWSRAAHGGFGFAALWVFGMLWGAHVIEGWRSVRRRWTGGLMFGLFSLLVISGYLLYYLGNDDLISSTSLVHWMVGIISPLPFLLHRLTGSGSKRSPA